MMKREEKRKKFWSQDILPFFFFPRVCGAETNSFFYFFFSLYLPFLSPFALPVEMANPQPPTPDVDCRLNVEWPRLQMWTRAMGRAHHRIRTMMHPQEPMPASAAEASVAASSECAIVLPLNKASAPASASDVCADTSNMLGLVQAQNALTRVGSYAKKITETIATIHKANTRLGQVSVSYAALCQQQDAFERHRRELDERIQYLNACAKELLSSDTRTWAVPLPMLPPATALW
jgi:hypothetical protein